MAGTPVLTAERLRQILRYDPETGGLWWKEPKGGRQMDKQAGSIVITGRSRQTVHVICIDYRKYYAHQLAWIIMTGYWPSEIDHRDGDPLNNRWENLREATRSQNNMNRRTTPGRLKGACFYKRTGRWQAYIKKDGRHISLGYFDTAEEAHEAYKEAARKLFGEFSRL